MRLADALQEDASTPDVTITCGAVPSSLDGAVAEGAAFQARSGAALLRVDGVARYLAEDGARITIDAASGAADGDVAAFLDLALGALLHQRGALVLSGSSVVIGDRAVILSGPPAIGTSTLAAALLQRGAALLSDGFSAVTFDSGGAPVVQPGLPRLALWPDALERLGTPFAQSAPMRPGVAKRFVQVSDSFRPQTARLERLCILQEGTRPELEREEISGFDRTLAVSRLVWRPPFLGGPHPPSREELRREPWAAHLRRVNAVAAACRVVRFIRPPRGFAIDALTDLVMATLEDR